MYSQQWLIHKGMWGLQDRLKCLYIGDGFSWVFKILLVKFFSIYITQKHLAKPESNPSANYTKVMC